MADISNFWKYSSRAAFEAATKQEEAEAERQRIRDWFKLNNPHAPITQTVETPGINIQDVPSAPVSGAPQFGDKVPEDPGIGNVQTPPGQKTITRDPTYPEVIARYLPGAAQFPELNKGIDTLRHAMETHAKLEQTKALSRQWSSAGPNHIYNVGSGQIMETDPEGKYTNVTEAMLANRAAGGDRQAEAALKTIKGLEIIRKATSPPGYHNVPAGSDAIPIGGIPEGLMPGGPQPGAVAPVSAPGVTPAADQGPARPAGTIKGPPQTMTDDLAHSIMSNPSGYSRDQLTSAMQFIAYKAKDKLKAQEDLKNQNINITAEQKKTSPLITTPHKGTVVDLGSQGEDGGFQLASGDLTLGDVLDNPSRYAVYATPDMARGAMRLPHVRSNIERLKDITPKLFGKYGVINKFKDFTGNYNPFLSKDTQRLLGEYQQIMASLPYEFRTVVEGGSVRVPLQQVMQEFNVLEGGPVEKRLAALGQIDRLLKIQEHAYRQDRKGSEAAARKTIAPVTGEAPKGEQRIRVQLKGTDKTGTILESEFDPKVYERIK